MRFWDDALTGKAEDGEGFLEDRSWEEKKKDDDRDVGIRVSIMEITKTAFSMEYSVYPRTYDP